MREGQWIGITVKLSKYNTRLSSWPGLIVIKFIVMLCKMEASCCCVVIGSSSIMLMPPFIPETIRNHGEGRVPENTRGGRRLLWLPVQVCYCHWQEWRWQVKIPLLWKKKINLIKLVPLCLTCALLSECSSREEWVSSWIRTAWSSWKDPPWTSPRSSSAPPSKCSRIPRPTTAAPAAAPSPSNYDSASLSILLNTLVYQLQER